MSSSSSYNKIPAAVSRVAAHGSSETAGTHPVTAVTSEVVGTPAGNRSSQSSSVVAGIQPVTAVTSEVVGTPAGDRFSQLSSKVVGIHSDTGVATQIVGTPPGKRLDCAPADVAGVARVTKEGLMAMGYDAVDDFETRLQEIGSLRSAGSPLLSLLQSTAIPTDVVDLVGDVMMAIFASSPHSPSHIPWSAPRWPLEVEWRYLRQHGVAAGPQNRHILVVGSTLGGYSPHVPDSISCNTIILRLRNVQGRSQYYGYSSEPYQYGRAQTWQGDINNEACDGVILALCCLQVLGCKAQVDFLGISAGVHQILAVVSALCAHQSQKSSPLLCRLEVRNIACISGAWHPTIYDGAKSLLTASGAMVVVHHHVCDTLCPWTPVKAFWEKVARESSTKNIHIIQLDQREHGLFQKTYHDTSWALLRCRCFWEMMASLDARDEVIVKCKSLIQRHELGMGHLLPPFLLVAASEYVNSHNDMWGTSVFALYILKVCRPLTDQHTTPNLAVDSVGFMGSWARQLAILSGTSSMSLQTRSVVRDHLSCCPAFDTYNLLFHNVVPHFVIEAVCAAMADDMYIRMADSRDVPVPLSAKIIQEFGILSHVHFGVDSLRYPSSYFVLLWERLPVEFDPWGREQANGGQSSATDDTTDNTGLQNFDLVALRLVLETTGDGSCKFLEVYEFTGFVVNVRFAKPKRQPACRWKVYSFELLCLSTDLTFLQSVTIDTAMNLEVIAALRLPHSVNVLPVLGQAVLHRRDVVEEICRDCCTTDAGVSAKEVAQEKPVRAKEVAQKKPGLVSNWANRGPSAAACAECNAEPLRLVAGEAKKVSSANASIITIIGPPGTGKTETSMRCLLDMTRSATDSAHVVLCTGPTKQSVHTMMRKLCDLAGPEWALEHGLWIKARGKPEDAQHGTEPLDTKFGTVNFPFLTLVLKNWPLLEQDLANKKPLYLFMTLGTSATGGYTAAPLLWKTVDALLVDEAGQILRCQAPHLPLYLKASGKMVFAGDPRQLSAFSRVPKPSPSLILPTMLGGYVVLQHQFRSVEALSRFISVAFYEDMLLYAAAGATDDQAPILFVILPNVPSQVGDACYPSIVEAEFIAELWPLLGWSPAKSVVLSAYQSQKRELYKRLPKTTLVKSIDEYQGSETDDVLISIGRKREQGFVGMRTRLNVAMSRARRTTVVVMHDAVAPLTDSAGSTLQASGNMLWALRTALGRVQLSLEPKHAEGRSAFARRVATTLQDRAIASDDIKAAFLPQATSTLPSDGCNLFAVCNRYQKESVGPLCIMREENDNDAARDDHSDDENPGPGAPTDSDMAVSSSVWMRAPEFFGNDARGAQTFAFVGVRRTHKLLMAETYDFQYQKGQPKGKATATMTDCRDTMMKGFARFLHWHLMAYYVGGGSPHEGRFGRFEGSQADWTAVLTTPIVYLGGPTTSLHALLVDYVAVYKWLLALNDNCRDTCYFWHGRHQRLESTEACHKQVKNELWQILLPYSILWPLLALRRTSRFRAPRGVKGEPQTFSNALLFELDIPVNDPQLPTYCTLRDLERQRHYTQKQAYDPSDYLLTLSPYNPVTRKDIDGTTDLFGAVQNLFVPLRLAVMGFANPPTGTAPAWFIDDALQRQVLEKPPDYHPTGRGTDRRSRGSRDRS
jgi:hypothetical protein